MLKTIITLLSLIYASFGLCDDKVLFLYQDADLNNHSESSIAIQQGIETAFAEINNTIDGYRIAFKYLDHRGNVVRSKRNYTTFINDEQALAIYSGVHAPPLIKNRRYINENKALTLVPWAAAGPVTRHPSADNWVFRLSIDDTRAGGFIIDYAMNEKQCQRPHLLLETSPWGDSNLHNMSAALARYSKMPVSVSRFSWNLQAQGARLLLRDIVTNQRDCLILVSNPIEGSAIAQALIDIDAAHKVKIISHWGITAGDFHDRLTAEKRALLDLSFIQTCFAFTNPQQSALAQAVFKRLKQRTNGLIHEAKDLKSAVGFIHAYDLSKLLIAAIEQAGLTGNMSQDRDRIRVALENLQQPIQGLIKTYQQPFSQFDIEHNTNGHEALDESDYCMAYFGPDNDIKLINQL